MTFFLRKSAMNARNVNRFRKVYTLVNIESHRSYSLKTKTIKISIVGVPFKLSSFHTSCPANTTVAFKLSDIGEGIREVVIKEWFVKVGDKVQQYDNICEVQSDKAAVTITSRYDGVVKRLYYEVDQTALVGNTLVDIEVENAEDEVADVTSDSTAESSPTTLTKISTNQRAKVLTTPAVRRIAAQFDVDLSAVKASGRNGRVLKEDVLSHLNINAEKSNEVPDMSVVTAASIPMIPAYIETEIMLEDRTVPISGFTRAMVKSMTEAMKIPHFGLSDEYEVTKLVESREMLKTIAQEKGIRLTYLPIILKAASLGLSKFPILNSSLDSSCEHLTYKASHNIGVAMDTPNGLVVPVIKNVQNKTILEIARELNILQKKGSNGQLGLSDLSGGTFTISNIGIIGGTYTKPVILPPQVAIGALGKIQVLPRFTSNGDVAKTHVLTVSWSADHRVIDGVTMARFSNYMKGYLENPLTLILDL
ncbi:lipoamide acyltransferase component of branched-chain alpha-keto acid dehydrogenase complex, mitochondrial isoform X2 [Amyelois transitella]|uniref:lipoamide acyltransferase component of branched-chain alpha-keto acid dehydrogenase complex, mitochondrial isoform X2 n=1 Tax=Amyelois transitella TaxID=680683 RepID=UPI002990259E|nr:lipoamide acyltransferase component of branched-chain alpha-keto acid dehydrogenase complex, mitochondrial isoform X2 [Amyelois transitella]